jgi:sugar lactone lactonase YvrE
VEAGTLDPSLWVGTQEGDVFRVDPNAPSDRMIVGEWTLGAPIGPIAMDQAESAAWVIVKRTPEFHDLYRITEADSTARLVRSGLDNVVDLAVDPASGDLWVSERGAPRSGTGALARLTRAGEEQLRIGSLEPYGLDVDLKDGTCWVAELRSNKILRVARNGTLFQASRTLAIPFEVRVQSP